MNKTKSNKLIYILIVSVLFTGFLSNKFTKDAIKYEVIQNIDNDEKYINTDISKITESDNGYIVIYKNDTLYVSTLYGEYVYKDSNINENVFTESDRNKLSKTGVKVSSLTELIEMLNYIKS